MAEISVPDDDSPAGQRWQVDIQVHCQEDPLLRGDYTILLSVGGAAGPRADWRLPAGIAGTSLAAALAWIRWRERRRTAWPTGLKAGHWR